jgi:hypothetical protein
MLTAQITGTVETADLESMTIRRDGADLVGAVIYKVTIDGVVQQRTATWTLTPDQKSAIMSDFVDSAIAAVAAHLGL